MFGCMTVLGIIRHRGLFDVVQSYCFVFLNLPRRFVFIFAENNSIFSGINHPPQAETLV
jgi:hypothetical protein